MNINQRVNNLEDLVIEIRNEMSWVKKIGYYMASLITALTIKLVGFS